MLASLWLILSVSLNSCKGNGPKVDVCIETNKIDGFQCVSKDKIDYQLSWFEGLELLCLAPQDMETFLKDCKQGVISRVPICKIIKSISKIDTIEQVNILGFDCQPNLNRIDNIISTLDAENYACVSYKDYKRIIERCK